MNLTTCDKCKKIKEEPVGWPEDSEWLEGNARGVGLRLRFDLCANCNKPLALYLKKYFSIQTDKLIKTASKTE